MSNSDLIDKRPLSIRNMQPLEVWGTQVTAVDQCMSNSDLIDKRPLSIRNIGSVEVRGL
jgi:hypothetical protein